MRHAGAAALDTLESMLQELRAVPGLTEKSRGVFYRRSKAFLHFHADPSGLYADVRPADTFVRYRVETADEQKALVDLVRSVSS